MDKTVFYDRVVYKDKKKYERLRCYDCGAKPEIHWRETRNFNGERFCFVSEINCPNGPHEVMEAVNE